MKYIVLVFFTCKLFLVDAYALEAEMLYKKCLGCHGRDAKHAPFERENGILSGREAGELKLIMQAIRDGNYKDDKLNKIMRKSIKNFSDTDIDVLSKYIATL
jgi:cytochrome c553